MTYRVVGLDPTPYLHLYGAPDAELAGHRARRVVVRATPGTPDRVSLRDLEPGAVALLVHHVHQPAETPFHASHAVYLEEGAREARCVVGRLPRVLRRRLLSLRAFDREGMLVDADVADGEHAEPLIERLLADPLVDTSRGRVASRRASSAPEPVQCGSAARRRGSGSIGPCAA
jgi:hypothetical protein